jgi:class 3 adenylate cyclase/pimeloyl-ACP methyl ester carboxylesterase
MVDRSRTRYAKSGDVHIAYQVVGSGEIDLVYIEGSLTHLDVAWELPAFRHFCERLGSFCRLIRFDKRGMGLSDHVRVGTLEERMEDVRAVMDAVGSERAAFLGESEGGPLALLFAATYPDRTRALILCGAEVKERTTDDWPWGEGTPEEFEQLIAGLADRWGEGRGAHYLAPSLDSPAFKEWYGRLCVQSASPGTAEAFVRMAFDIDVRGVLPAVRVPALVIHRVDDQICNVHNGRYLAEHLVGARYLELPGADHLPYAGSGDIVGEIREFLTGIREAEEPDLVLATLLFTDIVGSTLLAHELGNARWRDLLESHHAVVRRELVRFRGREHDTAGDGFFASFDGPARAIRCARSIVESVKREVGVDIRAGLHTGECEQVGDKLGGVAVHIGARVSALAAPGQVLVSRTVRDLVAGSGIVFDDRGLHTLKGVPGDWQLFSVAR